LKVADLKKNVNSHGKMHAPQALRDTFASRGASRVQRRNHMRIAVCALYCLYLLQMHVIRWAGAWLAPHIDTKPRILMWNTYAPHTNLSYADLMNETEGNTGNIVWSQAARCCIVDVDRVTLSHVRGVPSEVMPRASPEGFDVHFLPVDNMLWSAHSHEDTLQTRRHLRFIKRAFRRIKNMDRAVFMFGLGVQGYEPVENLISTASSYLLRGEYVQLLRAIEDRSGLIAVRGAFTARVCDIYGLSRVWTLGCPSLFLNASASLGRRMELELARLPANPRLVITLPGTYEPNVYRFLLALFGQNKDSLIILQGDIDLTNLERARRELYISVASDRLEYFSNVSDWARCVCSYDAVIGARIHGGMLAMGCGRPSILIPTDIRSKELGVTMALPMLKFQDLMRYNTSRKIDFRRIVRAVQFSGYTFDKNRQEVARGYQDALGSFGIRPSRIITTLVNTRLEVCIRILRRMIFA
jgi:hypothetical protein